MAVSADNERNTAGSSVLKRVTVYSIFKVLCVKHAVRSTLMESQKVAGVGRYRFELAGVYIASDTKLKLALKGVATRDYRLYTSKSWQVCSRK